MEKRAYTRQNVDFEVILSCHAIKDQYCKVKDFCIGGMLLSWEQRDVSRNPNLTTLIRNDALSITIDVPASSGQTKRYTLSAKAARVDGTNMGISFVHPDTNALASIQQLAKIRSQSNQSKPSASQINQEIKPSTPHFNSEARKRARSQYNETQERQILKQNLDIIEQFFEDKITNYFKELNEQLQTSIENAKDNAEQNQLFDAINKLRKYLKPAEEHIKTGILKPFSDYALKNRFDLSHLRKDNSSTKIGLIDKEEFEDWLVVKVMATKVETANTDALLELQLRFGELSGLITGTQNNPISPAVVCDAFNRVMTALPLELKIRKIIYRLFEQKVASSLSELYKNLNAQLDQAGILKDFDIVEHLGRIKQISGMRTNTQATQPFSNFTQANPQAQSEQKNRNEALTQNKPSTQSSNEQNSRNTNTGLKNRENPENRDHNQTQSSSHKIETINDLQALENSSEISKESLKNQLQSAQVTKPAARQFDVQQRIARNAADTVKRLISNHHNQAQAFQIAQTSEQIPLVESHVFSQKLSELQRQEPTIEENAPRLSERIYQGLQDENGEQRSLGDSENAALNVIERLFDSILDIDTLGENVRPWIKRLEIPFLKLLMSDENFLQDTDHPARKVLNTIAKLGQSGLSSSEQNLALISKSLQSIVEGFDKDISVFNSANHELESLLERQKKIFKKNIDRVQEAAQGQYKVKSAKRFVDSTLESILGGKEVPTALVVLLDAGWRELLNLTALRFGTNSDVWKDYEQIVYKLIDAANPKKEKPNLLELLKTIKTGLNAISSSGQFNDEKTITALGKLLKAERDEITVYAPKLEVPIGAYDPQVLEDTGIADDIWIRRAQKLQVGDWLEVDASADIFEQNDDDESENELTIRKAAQMRLAWIDEDYEDFVFVNHQGMKIVDVSIKQLAKLLREGLAKPIEDQDQPIVNLGLDRMVHKFYEQLVHHATHDELTGLMNQREFERQMKIALSESRQKAIQHSLACLDFKKIKEVNDSCGFEAGDEFLKHIACLLRENTPKNTILARIAGEQFSVLLPRVNEKTAQVLLNNLLKTFSKSSFDWKGKKFPIHCSIGICKITEHSESVSSVLNSAANACSQAALKGLNTIEHGQESDEQRKEVMQWENRLSEAITQNRLSLRCQKIKALSDESIPDQYEILLSMKDEAGNEVDTYDFIHAAECFEKMQLIDRWVIQNTLTWMQGSPEKLSKLGACGINLSSDSLNDESLLYYIFENLVEKNKVPRTKVCFEVTESTAVKNVADLADFVQEMQNIGCQFSLDDFGSESSSYGFLKNLSLNFVKIDGNFINQLATNDNDYAMVKSINEMVHFMGKKTIAKQVEDQATIDKLKEIGVDFVQGYAVEAPIALNDL